MEESRKVYGRLVRDRNAAVGCSSKKGMAGCGVSQTVEIRSVLFSNARNFKNVNFIIDNRRKVLIQFQP